MRALFLTGTCLALAVPAVGLSAQTRSDAIPYLQQGDSYRGLFRGVESSPHRSWDNYQPGDAARLIQQIDLLDGDARVDRTKLRRIRRSAVSLARTERSYLRGGISTGERAYMAYPYARIAYSFRRLLAQG